MKEYFRYFRFPFIAVVILAIATLVVTLTNGDNSAAASGEGMSTNTERTTTERVFDYADKLSDAEEEALREEIREAEEATKCDIVIVTLNESLEEYAKQYEDVIGSVETKMGVMVYADNFYDEHNFGYDKAHGNGVLYLDNWYRESDGWVYSWMSTCGTAMDRYSSSMIDDVVNTVNSYVEDDPYRAYSAFVKTFREDMMGADNFGGVGSRYAVLFTPAAILIAALIAALIFLIVNWFSKKGKRTTTSRTYVAGGNPVFRAKEDRFLYKNVTKHRIESSSGGGGGGSHRSAGGVRHGGGGGRR